jgi:hypothetical protein
LGKITNGDPCGTDNAGELQAREQQDRQDRDGQKTH